MSKLLVGPKPWRRLYWRGDDGRTTAAYSGRKLPDNVLDYLEQHLPPVPDDTGKTVRTSSVGGAGEVLPEWRRFHPDSEDWKTFDTVSRIICMVCDVELGKISRSSHFAIDLHLDELDFLDVVSEVDRSFGVKLPRERWVAGTKWASEPREFFAIGVLCHFIDQLVAAKG